MKSKAEPEPAPKAEPKPVAKPTPAPKAEPKPVAKPKPAAKAARPPAFAAAGAPPEPRDEISLPERARRLAAFVAAHPKPTDAAVRHWLYQHNWIVAGARFGWWRGAAALETLVQVDRRVERQWGIGAKSRRAAVRALAEVRARS